MTADTNTADAQSPAGLDRIIHEPARLLVLAQLFEMESADFLYLLRHTGLSKGNLSTHLRKLEQAGYVDVEKVFVEKLPMTVIRLTDSGREAIAVYRGHMLELLAAFEPQD